VNKLATLWSINLPYYDCIPGKSMQHIIKVRVRATVFLQFLFNSFFAALTSDMSPLLQAGWALTPPIIKQLCGGFRSRSCRKARSKQTSVTSTQLCHCSLISSFTQWSWASQKFSNDPSLIKRFMQSTGIGQCFSWQFVCCIAHQLFLGHNCCSLST